MITFSGIALSQFADRAAQVKLGGDVGSNSAHAYQLNWIK